MQIIDNKKKYKANSEIKTVKDWINEKTKNGKRLDVVTGYITIGALEWLNDEIKGKVDEFRFIIGDFVEKDAKKLKKPVIDLLSEKISSEDFFKLTTVARKAVDFLESENVQVKSICSSLCHAKAYMYVEKENDDLNYCIIGSANLTSSGIGDYDAGNIELNLANTGDNLKEVYTWFDELFNDSNRVQDYKERLIQEIKKIYKPYKPYDIYLKMLYTMNKDEINARLTQSIDTSLKETNLWKLLYGFQKDGVNEVIAKLEKFNGAILADAVGLGKTFQALAVIYYYYRRGYDVTVFCPKKLELGWRKFLDDKQNQLYQMFGNNARYKVRFHTDLTEKIMNGHKYKDNPLSTFQDSRPKLFIIDESHNFRNKNAARYKFFLEEMVKKNEDVKLLMLSATPLNNSYMDIANQLLFITKGDEYAFKSTLDVRKTITQVFNDAQKRLEDAVKKVMSIEDLFKYIDSNATDAKTLRENLILARTRQMIAGKSEEDGRSALVFPKHGILRDENNDDIEDKIQDDKTLRRITGIDNLEDFIKSMPLMSAYQPGVFIQQAGNLNAWNDKKKRDQRLVRMLFFMLFKRYESSWYSFYMTLKKFLAKHKEVLALLENHEKDPDAVISGKIETGDSDEDDDINENLESSAIKVSDIVNANVLVEYTKAVKEDLAGLKKLTEKFDIFNKKVEAEKHTSKSEDLSDDKLQQIIHFLKAKPNHSQNSNEFGKNKVLIFTSYKDSAEYLYENLRARGFEKIAMVSGDYNRVWDHDGHTKKHDKILKRFSPFSQIFLEMEWDGFYKDKNKSNVENYRLWKNEWLPSESSENTKFAKEIINNPIDILIATDCLSEGQNFQDCDTVLHFDIHWNPVRLVQRFGRIDRIGSPNEEVYSVYCWVTESVNKYLALEDKINIKSAAAASSGQENAPSSNKKVDEINNYFNRTMLEQCETEEHIPENKKTELCLTASSNALSNAMESIRNNVEELLKLPNGICSTFSVPSSSGYSAPGIIALVDEYSNDNKYQNYRLLYISDRERRYIKDQDEILKMLQDYCKPDSSPAFPKNVEFDKYSKSLTAVLEEIKKSKKPTSPPALAKIQHGIKIDELNYNLVAWLYVDEK